jgi:hypothetical protein
MRKRGIATRSSSILSGCAGGEKEKRKRSGRGEERVFLSSQERREGEFS